MRDAVTPGRLKWAGALGAGAMYVLVVLFFAAVFVTSGTLLGQVVGGVWLLAGAAVPLLLYSRGVLPRLGAI